jgi:predicted TIM-barrel fold metal-dependent hydrolase
VANISDASPGYDDARLVHHALLEANVERLVWGSDWPHTRPSGVAPRTDDLFGLFLDWTPSSAERERILRRNPQKLYNL